jgi:hypothetical protein
MNDADSSPMVDPTTDIKVSERGVPQKSTCPSKGFSYVQDCPLLRNPPFHEVEMATLAEKRYVQT